REEYYPFGETSFGSYGKKRYRFCGKEKDEESGLYYYGARSYSSWTCRFISVDPLAGKYAQLTPYNYAGNEPIGDKDIDGMQSQNTDTSQTSAPAPNSDSTPTQTAGTNVNCHQVKKDETLGGIAKKYGVTVDALRKANNLDPKDDKDLDIGRELKIPNASHSNENTIVKIPISLHSKMLEKVSKETATRFLKEFETNNGLTGQEAAKKLKNSKRVEFFEIHPNKHTPNDKANASDNIRDAANGKPVYRSNYENAKGGTVELNPKLLLGLLELSEKYKFSVQELAGGSHKIGSEHYNGNSVDINWLNGEHVNANHPDAKQFIKDAEKLGFIINNEWKLKKAPHFHMTIK
ncbi:MAG: RHS repeat-associated core domain-containing protein, partial [Bacteroidota bacterium]|nr:RHS repeat-associated core domain-containing protein [Bacteroidota bacterium]